MTTKMRTSTGKERSSVSVKEYGSLLVHSMAIKVRLIAQHTVLERRSRSKKIKQFASVLDRNRGAIDHTAIVRKLLSNMRSRAAAICREQV